MLALSEVRANLGRICLFLPSPLCDNARRNGELYHKEEVDQHRARCPSTQTQTKHCRIATGSALSRCESISAPECTPHRALVFGIANKPRIVGNRQLSCSVCGAVSAIFATTLLSSWAGIAARRVHGDGRNSSPMEGCSDMIIKKALRCNEPSGLTFFASVK